VTDLERRIVATVAAVSREGMQLRAFLLTPKDYRALKRTSIDGVPVRRANGKRASAIYTQQGVCRLIRKRVA
jgi:hypothetical protein